MTVTVTSFRAQFPEFGDATVYPDPMVTRWLTVAARLVNAERWGDLADTGVGLCAAHWISQAAANMAAANAGRTPGQMTGVLTSKSADGISASYEVQSITVEGAHHYNLTKYGVQFKDLARMMGAGPLYVGIGTGSALDEAWQGVIQPVHG